MRNLLQIAICLVLTCAAAFPAQAQPVMERLGRGVVAVSAGDGFYISWRLLADDGDHVTFNIYRSTDGGKEVRLNSTPIAETTDFTDNGADPAKTNTWTVYPVYGRKQSRTGESFTVRANAPRVNYLTIPLQVPEPGEVGGRTYT